VRNRQQTIPRATGGDIKRRHADFTAFVNAGAPQVIAYSTAWALHAIHRLVMWEVPMMPARVVWLRAAVSLPLPFIAAVLAMLVGRP
jgi:hypothetical protein